MTELTSEPRNLMPNWVSPKAWLTSKAWVLNLWMNARLLPSTSTSLESRRRALLLYAMCKSLSINVERVINEEMRAATHPMESNQAIDFPSLITALCKKAWLRALTDPAEHVSLISDIVWKKLDKLRPAQGGPSSSRPQGEDEAH